MSEPLSWADSGLPAKDVTIAEFFVTVIQDVSTTFRDLNEIRRCAEAGKEAGGTIQSGQHMKSTIKARGQIHVMSSDMTKATSHIIVEIIEYITNSVVCKTIIKRSTGNVSVMSFDTGEGLTEKTSPFDTFVQIIEGQADIVIDRKSNLLQTGMGIIIPAHAANYIRPDGRFKMILTIIKSGYE